MGTFGVGPTTFCIMIWPWVYRGQGLEYVGLNMNGPHRLIWLNIWSLIGRPVWEEFGGTALLEEACYWGWALKFQKSMLFPVCPLPRCYSAVLETTRNSPSGPEAQLNTCFWKLSWLVLYHSTRKWPIQPGTECPMLLIMADFSGD